ncbi:recombination regulator RecX [Pasteurella oralis]|uniref:recombination regulator RecX n=1 Tax=Pasteurella oralis TaxID=1071947 RepID=UPI000C7B60DE|nr:recombination regulator RecX [Pasteurella oralis]
MSSQALNYVISLLARREYSEFEIRCKMQEKHFSEQEIDEVLAYCQQKNWQNDQRFTENYLIFRAQRGYGFSRIKQELQQLKGINSVVIQQALNEAEVNWSELAFNLVRKKFPDFATISDLKIKQKIWRYMLSHGFRPEDFSDYIGSGIEE